MAGRGPAPKPAHLRQRRNKKAGAATLAAPIGAEVPAIPNPDGRTWHELTVRSWARAWASPMASMWLEADVDALGRLAILWDAYYQSPTVSTLAEIRLQESRFGLSPLDRSRLQWEVNRAEGTEGKRPSPPSRRADRGVDPRLVLVK